MRTTERKIVLVTRKTRLENLIRKYNTIEQAKFVIEHSGSDFRLCYGGQSLQKGCFYFGFRFRADWNCTDIR